METGGQNVLSFSLISLSVTLSLPKKNFCPFGGDRQQETDNNKNATKKKNIRDTNPGVPHEDT